MIAEVPDHPGLFTKFEPTYLPFLGVSWTTYAQVRFKISHHMVLSYPLIILAI